MVRLSAADTAAEGGGGEGGGCLSVRVRRRAPLGALLYHLENTTQNHRSVVAGAISGEAM